MCGLAQAWTKVVLQLPAGGSGILGPRPGHAGGQGGGEGEFWDGSRLVRRRMLISSITFGSRRRWFWKRKSVGAVHAPGSIFYFDFDGPSIRLLVFGKATGDGKRRSPLAAEKRRQSGTLQGFRSCELLS
jgi:hypothetical protein